MRLDDGRILLAEGEPVVRLSAVGDLMLGAGVGERIQHDGPGHPFGRVKRLLATSDIRFANLEWPLTNTERRHPAIRHRPRFAPPAAISSLKDADFSVVSVANNHIFDCLDDGLADTFAILAQHDIDWVGAGRSVADARTPALRVANGIRFGFLAYTFPLHQIATAEMPGCAPYHAHIMLEDVQRLRNRVDHVVVSMHTGPDLNDEFGLYPSPARQETLRRLIDEGASAILCHHCHVPQGIEVHRGGLIAHGLGSFITDIHDWYFQSAPLPQRDYIDKAMILQMEFDASRLLGFTVVPTSTGADLAVRPMEGAHRESFLRFLQDISSPLYDATRLEERLPGQSWRAKLGRLRAKARTKGLHGLIAELSADVLRQLDHWFVEPRRVRELERDLKVRQDRFADPRTTLGDT